MIKIAFDGTAARTSTLHQNRPAWSPRS